MATTTTTKTPASAPDRLDRRVPPAWPRFVRAHATIMSTMDAHLQAAHGLTINDYEVLLALARAPERRMRRVDLAGQVLLTQSGITRLLQGLERAGLVERAACDTDRRVVYACLTDDGHALMREASRTHLDDIRSLFVARFSDEQLDQLDLLLGRVLEDGPEPDCTVPD